MNTVARQEPESVAEISHPTHSLTFAWTYEGGSRNWTQFLREDVEVKGRMTSEKRKELEYLARGKHKNPNLFLIAWSLI